MSKASEFARQRPDSFKRDVVRASVDAEGDAHITRFYGADDRTVKIWLNPEDALALGKWLVATYE